MKPKHLSPFQRLRREIENELYDAALQHLLLIEVGEELNSDFILGYVSALKRMLEKADYIYKYKDTPQD